MSLRAMSGGELIGDRFVRYAYLDESGTGNPVVEPYIIVAGIILHADKQYKSLEKYLLEMADAFALAEDRNDFVFHAQSLFTGGNREFKAKYSQAKRHQYLLHLCETPGKFDLPIVLHAMDREKLAASRPSAPAKELLAEGLMHSSLECAQGIERFMREHAETNEVATIIYEQNGEFSKRARGYHNLFRSRMFPRIKEHFQLEKVIALDRVAETALFAEKADGSPLQLSDACAYIFNRALRGKGDVEKFLAPLRRQVFYGEKSERILGQHNKEE